jgi:hypothetical protein
MARPAAGRGDEEGRHPGRAQREPGPIGRPNAERGPDLVMVPVISRFANLQPGRASQWVPARRG